MKRTTGTKLWHSAPKSTMFETYAILLSFNALQRRKTWTKTALHFLGLLMPSRTQLLHILKKQWCDENATDFDYRESLEHVATITKTHFNGCKWWEMVPSF